MNTTSPEDAPESRPLRKSGTRRFIVAIIWIVTVLALAYAVENWRGRQAWQAYVEGARARDERIDLESIIPPAVPDEQNFAHSPLFLPLFDYELRSTSAPMHTVYRDDAAQKAINNLRLPAGEGRPKLADWRRGRSVDLSAWQEFLRDPKNATATSDTLTAPEGVLSALEAGFGKQLRELAALAPRPHSRFPVRYEDGTVAMLPHLGPLKSFAEVLSLRASAHLAAGQPDLALSDELLIYRLADALKDEPLLISLLVRNAILEYATSPVWEGLARHRWSEAHLAALDKTLAPINLVAGYQLAVRGERNLFAFAISDMIRRDARALSGIDLAAPSFLFPVIPQGWVLQNQANLGASYQRLLDCSSVENARIDPECAAALQEEYGRLKRGIYRILEKVLVPAIVPVQTRVAFSQSSVSLLRVAIALERHRIAHGSHPADLNAVEPLLGSIPTDSASGKAPNYSPKPDGTFLLYYDGWNQTDDGGTPAWKDAAKTNRDDTKGDVVWPQAAAL